MIARAPSDVYAGAALLLAALASSACAPRAAPPQSTTVDGYEVRLGTQPSPPQVGRSALLVAMLESNGRAEDGCRVDARQFMAEHEMSGDNEWHALKPAGDGEYRGQSGDFSMGGEWQVELRFTCANRTRRAMFAYALTWPE